MILPHVRMASSLALALAIGSVASSGEAPTPEPPLRNEDVVRLHVSGVATDELIELIRTSDVDFDLAEEMRVELRRAGLTPALLRAMSRRQAEAVRQRAEVDVKDAPGAPLRILLEARRDRPVRVRDEIDPRWAMRWELPASERRFSDIAIFLACRTPSHVPDQWQNHTPLTGEIGQMARHEMLAFAPGAERVRAGFFQRFGFRPTISPFVRDDDLHAAAGTRVEGKRDKHGVLELEVPPALEASLEPGVAHDLTVGIALGVGDVYYPWRLAALDGVFLDRTGRDLRARIAGQRSLRLEALEIEFVPDGDAPAADRPRTPTPVPDRAREDP